jgi:hypothetical protein
MNKAEIIAELESMAVARLFSGQPWLADWETFSAFNRKLVQMGLVEQVEPETWRYTSLGKEVDVGLFEVFMGLIHEWDVLATLGHYGLIDESEGYEICECKSDAEAESVLIGYAKRAYHRWKSPEYQSEGTVASD